MAIPKGRLQGGVLAFLQAAGLSFDFRSDRDYRPTSSDAGVVAKLFKPRAIPQLVALGLYDLGFCGLDLVREADYDLVLPVLDLGLNPVTLVVAVRQDHESVLDDPPRRPLLVASEYVNIADRWALDRNLAHITIQTWGSTEAYAPEDADVVFDCVETGRTMEANGLKIVERLMRSTTHLIANRLSMERPDVQSFVDRWRNAT